MAGLADDFGILSVDLLCAMLACLLGSSVSSQTHLINQIWDH